MGQSITTLLRRFLGGEPENSLLSDHHRHDNYDEYTTTSLFDPYWKMVQAIIRILRRLLGCGGAGKPPSDQFSSYPHHYCIDVGIDTTVNDQEVVVQGPSLSDEEADVAGDSLLPLLPEPEKQLRWGVLGPYSGSQLILLVGEGDFSFSASLAVAFGDASNMVATSLDSLKFLKKNYKKAMANISELKNRGCEVLHQVDATKMVDHPRLCSRKFNYIIYNFPHAGFSKLKEPRDVQISHHQALVRGFMANAKEMIEDDGQIHITHKYIGFSKDWNIELLGSSEGLRLIEAVRFKLQMYAGYCTKYGYGGDKDFDWEPSKTYKFQLASVPKKKKQRRKQRK